MKAPIPYATCPISKRQTQAINKCLDEANDTMPDFEQFGMIAQPNLSTNLITFNLLPQSVANEIFALIATRRKEYEREQNGIMEFNA